ncbi:Nitric oxide synthase, inducible [Saguinus oedipus]|uniref:Nitric oxide synthase, inducible n=1 Tax=Saguinus oedipus TaxID=9490 RepID=A0ABQ9VQU4_SAGOE|nr:Nitric oxide synthase, inducible [Saguinus oedipus]
MDHHSAAESFMKYMQNEYRARGGCPADWIWLVPPISGSITPVFHQEMLNYVLSPFYYYQNKSQPTLQCTGAMPGIGEATLGEMQPQPSLAGFSDRDGVQASLLSFSPAHDGVEAWKTHDWQDKKRRPKRREIPLKVLVKAVLFACMLMRKTMASRVGVTILFATETGKSEALAWDLGALFSCAFNPKVLCMDKYRLSCLEEERLLLVVTSTFGNGDCPSNGEKLKKSLFTLKELTNKFR